MRRATLELALCAAAGVCLLSAVLAHAAEPSSVACAVDPALVTGTSLALHAWAIDTAGAAAELPAKLQWRVDKGTVAGDAVVSGAGVRWTLPEPAHSRPLQARLVGADGTTVCVVSARQVPEIRGTGSPGRTAGHGARARNLLLTDSDEPRGYAALSYLLLPAPPAPAQRERFLRLLAAWLRELPDTTEMELYVERDQLTLFVLPVRAVPVLPPDAGNTEDPARWRLAAQAVLAQYDHARAQAMLARMGLAGAGPGPLLVARQAAVGSAAAPYLVEDFSTVDAGIAEAWMRWSLNLVAQPREKSGQALQRVALTLRNVIAHAARGLPDGGAATRDWIKFSPL